MFLYNVLLRLARSEMEKYSFTFRPSEDAKKVNTAQLAARLNERSEFQQYLGACPEEPLF